MCEKISFYELKTFKYTYLSEYIQTELRFCPLRTLLNALILGVTSRMLHESSNNSLELIIWHRRIVEVISK